MKLQTVVYRSERLRETRPARRQVREDVSDSEKQQIQNLSASPIAVVLLVGRKKIRPGEIEEK